MKQNHEVSVDVLSSFQYETAGAEITALLILSLCSMFMVISSPNKTEFIKAKYQMLAYVHRMPCREDDSVTAKDLSKVTNCSEHFSVFFIFKRCRHFF